MSDNKQQVKRNRKQEKQEIMEAIRGAVENLPSPVLTRGIIEDVTGRAIKSRNLANLDCLGLGIPGGFTMGRKKCYLAANFLSWLESRLEV